MEEIWKDIPGYDGLYQVSNLGSVRALNYNKRKGRVKMMSKIVGHNGYLYVMLSKNCVYKRFLIHRLVASCFIEKPDGKNEIDHIDGNNQNNVWINLRWSSHQENLNNPITKKRFRDSKVIPVIQSTLDGRFVREWECAKDAERVCGFHSGDISKCCKGKAAHAGGYKWSYK